VAVVAVAPRFTDDRKLSRAADQLAQILLTAKQRSKRDLIPTGVRLFPDPQHNNLITELQYIQQPDDFSPAGSMVILTSIPNSAAFTIASNFPQSTSWPPANWPPAGWTGSVLVAQAATPGLDFTGGFGNSALWPVQAGDYLNVKGAAHLIYLVSPTTLLLAPVAPYQPSTSIAGVSSSTLQFTPSANTAQIAAGMIVTAPWGSATTTIRSVNNTTIPMSITTNPPPNTGVSDWIGFLPASAVSAMPQPTTYSVIRRPRVLQGETPLQLPAGICIDPTPKIINAATGQSVDPYAFAVPGDIMFSPQGGTLNSGLAAGQDSIVLWVRDYTKDVSYPVTSWPPGGQPGEQFVIFIQTHTGFIAEHPVDVTPGNGPYTFTQDARSSGL